MNEGSQGGASGAANPPMRPSHGRLRSVWRIAKWVLFALVLAFVARRGVQLWQEGQDAFTLQRERLVWLLPAAVSYAAGWLPAVWIWRQALVEAGVPLSWSTALRAYYSSHLGKYVPGKALVLVIRGAVVDAQGGSGPVAALATVYETLLTMATGGILSALLTPLVAHGADSQSFLGRWAAWLGLTFWPLLLVLMVVLVLAARAGTVFLHRWVWNRHGVGNAAVPPFQPRRVLVGILFLAGGWWLHGMSLGLCLRALGAESAFHVSEWPLWTQVVSLATVSGFVAVFAPAGVGVREGVMIELLRSGSDVPGRIAVAAAILLRLVWLATEVLVAVSLMLLARGEPHRRRTEPSSS